MRARGGARQRKGQGSTVKVGVRGGRRRKEGQGKRKGSGRGRVQ